MASDEQIFRQSERFPSKQCNKSANNKKVIFNSVEMYFEHMCNPNKKMFFQIEWTTVIFGACKIKYKTRMRMHFSVSLWKSENIQFLFRATKKPFKRTGNFFLDRNQMTLTLSVCMCVAFQIMNCYLC